MVHKTESRTVFSLMYEREETLSSHNDMCQLFEQYRIQYSDKESDASGQKSDEAGAEKKEAGDARGRRREKGKREEKRCGSAQSKKTAARAAPSRH